MKTFLKYGILYTTLFSLAAGGAFAFQAKPKSNKNNGNNTTNITAADDSHVSAGERLFASLMGYEGMNIKANIDMVTKDNKKFAFDFVGGGSIQDLNDIKIGGDLLMNINGFEMDADFSYFGNELAFVVLDNYFKLEEADLLDFIQMVPTYGIELELPEGLENLDINTLTDEITSLEAEDKKTLPAGGYYYTLNIGDLSVKVKTDEEDNFKGIIIDPFFYNDMKFSLTAELEETKIANINSLNQLNGENAYKFQNFSPAFTLFDVASKFVKQDKMSINVGLVLDEEKEGLFENFLATDINVNFDKTTSKFSLDGDISENGRTHSFIAAYEDNTVYANYHNLYLSIENGSIYDLIGFAIDKIGTEKIGEVLNTVIEEAGKTDIDEILDKVTDMVGHIGVEEQSFSLNLDLSVFDESLKPLDVIVTFDNQELKTLQIKDLSINNFTADVVVGFNEYNAPVIQKDRYVALEPAMGLIPTICDLVNETSFRLEFDALVDKEEGQDVTIDGGFQFDIKDNFGYGEMNIVDSDSYLHNVKADMKNKDEFLFSYNNKLNGKFSSKTLEDMLDLVKEIVADPDEHFMELFGDMLLGESALLIQQVLDGKYGALLKYNIIDNLAITEEAISFDVSLELVNLDTVVHMEIGYTTNPETHYSDLESLKISGIELDGASISANVRLKKFNPNLQSTRLDPSLSYMDFSDIKVLLELGVKTSEFNYYHFSATATLSLGSWDIKELPIDVKIRNEKGSVKVDAYLSDIPVIALVNPNDEYYSASKRSAHVYYYNDNIYIQRNETVKTALLFGKTKSYELTRRCSVDYFLDNILDILLVDILSMSDLVMNLINGSDDTSEEKQQIHYEELINDFLYNEQSGYFYADINLAEIAHDKKFSLLTAKIYEDKTNHILKGIDAHLTIKLSLISINLDLSLSFLDDRSVEIWTYDEQGNVTGDYPGTSMTQLESFVQAHQNDTLNQKYSSIK